MRQERRKCAHQNRLFRFVWVFIFSFTFIALFALYIIRCSMLCYAISLSRVPFLLAHLRCVHTFLVFLRVFVCVSECIVVNCWIVVCQYLGLPLCHQRHYCLVFSYSIIIISVRIDKVYVHCLLMYNLIRFRSCQFLTSKYISINKIILLFGIFAQVLFLYLLLAVRFALMRFILFHG